MKCPIPEEDLNKDELEYDVDTDNENYIKWITRGEGGSFEDSPTGLYAENNNNVATTSQENTFTNENQNNIDILNESSQCDYNNIISEKNNNMPQLSKILEEDNISAEDPSDLHELISEEDSEKLDKEILKKINKLNQQEDELKQKKLLLQNEERELELKIKKEKQEFELLLKNENQEQPDNMMNKNNSDESKNTDENKQQYNMRNKKKPKTYDYNLSLQDLQKDKSKLFNIYNGGGAFGFSYP